MKILNRIITFVTTVFVIIACIVFAATAICKIGNIEPRIVLSGSMEPKIHTGSICFINKKVPYDKIKTGDIIAFKAGKNTMVTHRVISVTNAGFETKGDANKVSDGISTNKTNYRGKTILSIPYAGYISMYLQSTRGKIILVSVIVALFIAGLILPQEKNQEEVKKEYLRDLEIFVRFRLHSSYPLREICDVTKTERKECHESYNHLVHLRNPETEEKWRLENLINHAWQQYVDLYTEGKEREYLLTYFHCSIMNFIDGHLEDGINYYFFPESKANSLILL